MLCDFRAAEEGKKAPVSWQLLAAGILEGTPG
jgi:hypothetical protein